MQHHQAQNDMLNRPLSPGEYVVADGTVFQFIKHDPDYPGLGEIVLLHSSANARCLTKRCNDMCIIDKNAVLLYLLQLDTTAPIVSFNAL